MSVCSGRLGAGVAFALAGFGFEPSLAAATSDGLQPETQRVAFTQSAFLGVNHADAEAAFRVFSRTFGVMAELNPQVRGDLQAVAASEPLVNAVICLNQAGWSSDRFRRDLNRALNELDDEPAGRQILTLFKTGRLAPFEDSHLESVRKLYARASALAAPAPGGVGDAGANSSNPRPPR